MTLAPGTCPALARYRNMCSCDDEVCTEMSVSIRVVVPRSASTTIMRCSMSTRAEFNPMRIAVEQSVWAADHIQWMGPYTMCDIRAA